MKQTTKYTDLIIAELKRLGVEHAVHPVSFQGGYDYITVDRTSMVNCAEGPGGDEQATYDFILARLQEVCGAGTYVTWSGRTDDYLGVEVFTVGRML